MNRPAAFAILAALFAGMGVERPALAEDFRMENKVYVGNEREPCAESTTIFYNGAAYDFLKKPPEITVFDKDVSRFILLDTERRVKTELTAQEVAEFVERLRQRAAEYAHPFAAFQANPKFEQAFDASARELSFTSPWMTYRVVTIDAGSREAASQYRRFADWQARLNTLINPKAIRPFGRLEVNAELEQREELPKEVHLVITPGGTFPPKRVTFRSEHQLVRRVVESDRARVQQAGEFIAIFPVVSFEEYQKTHAGR